MEKTIEAHLELTVIWCFNFKRRIAQKNQLKKCYYLTSITSPMAKWDLLYRDLIYEGVSSKVLLYCRREGETKRERERDRQTERQSETETGCVRLCFGIKVSL